ncbi:hypothetical protein BA177_10660 [Woeseia oceani]|uniref:DUF4034 domain-containing protein n=1 Tax=Woeseia oceani TaxID=1548547 RepID=A0A193LL80_9GAMM|nr:hypothetical protein BA177_10660 [Woeseia oceani]
MNQSSLYLRGLLLSLTLSLAGCASLVSSAASNFSDNLSAAVLNQNDPQTVRDGAPSYLLLLDSFIEGNPENPDVLAAAAQLYASYGAVFATEPGRSARLTERARSYGGKALCLSFAPSCNWREMDFEAFEQTLDELKPRNAEYLLAYSVASLAWIRAHSDDWNALAELPHMEAMLTRYLDIGEPTAAASVYSYLGILATLRPPALGGKPEEGRAYFERAVELTGGADLGVKLEFARGYARLMYDRDLHDRLLQEVLAADPVVDGFTLTNVLAQQDAAALLESADDYF